MNKFAYIIVILAFAMSAFGQKSKVGADYDKFKDETTVSFNGYGVGVSENISFTFSGKDLKADAEEFMFWFGGNRCRGYCFDDPEFIMIIDGRRSAVYTDKRLDNSAIFTVPRSEVEAIANATLVEYRVGSFQGKWEQKTIGMFKELLALGTVKK